VASFGSVALDLAAPYLIRYVSPAFAPLQVANGALMSLVLLVLLAALCLPAQGRAAPVAVFGSAELPADPRFAVPEWARVLRGIAAETPVYDACGRGDSCPSPAARDWLALLNRLAGAPPLEQLRAVNGFFNRFPYRGDRENYGRRDYWATPLEFLARSGDCEDYAIAKYVSLRRLGVAPDRLRLAVVQDTDRDAPHAVLLADVGGTWYVLDNLSERVEPQERVGHYVPYYSLNEEGFWAHALPPDLMARQERVAAEVPTGPRD
jgi:predicted transglutaminase-like cysteine proteinase